MWSISKSRKTYFNRLLHSAGRTTSLLCREDSTDARSRSNGQQISLRLHIIISTGNVLFGPVRSSEEISCCNENYICSDDILDYSDDLASTVVLLLHLSLENGY